LAPENHTPAARRRWGQRTCGHEPELIGRFRLFIFIFGKAAFISADDMSAANIVARRFCAELCLSKPVRTVFVGRLLTVIAGRARLGEMRLLNILFDCAAVLCDTPAWRAIGAMETEAALVIVS